MEKSKNPKIKLFERFRKQGIKIFNMDEMKNENPNLQHEKKK